MARVIIIAEGQTEEKFVKSLIFPYFHNKNLFDISVSILPSKVTASGKRYKLCKNATSFSFSNNIY